MTVEQTLRLPLSERVNDQNLQSDIIKKKRIIKRILYTDPAIIEALNNTNLDPTIPEDYLNINIFSYLKIPGTQDTVNNYICFEIEDRDISSENDVIKNQYLTVVCMSNEAAIKTQFDMIDRHDLLGYLVIENLNRSNILGMQLKLVSDVSSIIDTKYQCRVLKFYMKAPNGIENGGTGKYDKFIQR